METLTFQCGHCSKLMAVGMAFLGQQVRCPHCQQVVIAPSQPAPTSALPEAANEADPLAANPSTESPFAVAPDAPSSATPATTATDPPPSIPDHSPSPYDEPFKKLNVPPLEITPLTEATAPPPFLSFEAAVEESTPAAPAGAAVLDAPTQQTEARPAPAFEPPPTVQDVATPWGQGATAFFPDAPPSPVIAPRPRRSQIGMMLFISLVFLPLLLYAVLVTILAVMFYQRLGESGGGQDPRQILPDVEGDHPGVKHSKQSWVVPDNYYTDPLPRSQRVALGKTLTIGDLEVQPERVEWGTVRIRAGPGRPMDGVNPSLILHLKLRNISEEVSFYPLDTYFNRQWSKGEGQRPLTLVEAGSARYYGGPTRWNGKDPEAVEGSNFDKELGPGESGAYLVCTNCYEETTQKLAKYAGPLLWRVQLRRGLVRYHDKDYSATAVIGVEFSDKDIVRSGTKP